MNRKKAYIVVLTMVSFVACGQAQEVGDNIWGMTVNAAGIGRDTVSTHGMVGVRTSHTAGELHRVQDGGQKNSVGFTAEKWQTIGQKLSVSGSFEFEANRTKDRAWADVLRPYESNPFISGSSVKGKYDTQMFCLKAQMSSLPIGRMTYGMGLEYTVGDLSRLKDPRSRVELAEYALRPAVTFEANDAVVLGLEWHYSRRKEKLIGLTTVADDANLTYYVMSGLENAIGTLGGYSAYSRQYVSHTIGIEVSSRLKKDNVCNLTSIGLEGEREYIEGSNRYQPGRYFSRTISMCSKTWTKSLTCITKAYHNQAYADQYKQVLQTTKDSETGVETKTWQTQIRYDKRWQMKKTTATIEVMTKHLGLHYDLRDVRMRHVVPLSEMNYCQMTIMAMGRASGRRNNFLWRGDGRVGFSGATSTKLKLNNADAPMAKEVLEEDMNVIAKNIIPMIVDISLGREAWHGTTVWLNIGGKLLLTEGINRRTSNVSLTIEF